jgi:pSer/pThr/pTyr-binding forkhead associated (FHA) protein
MPAKITLTVTQGSLKGQIFEFSDRTTCIIGRAGDCYVQLPNDEAHGSISRYHCRLDINPPLVRVRDFGSKNGTYVNGKKIGQRQSDQTAQEAVQMEFPEYELKDGDEIRLSKTVFRVSIETGTAAQETETLEPRAGANLPEETETLPRRGAAVLPTTSEDGNLPEIAGYTTLKLLGKGGCGAVYLARHNGTGEKVALKVMLPERTDSPRHIDWFLREVENTKALKHPNVVRLLDSGYGDGTFFGLLEYCDGGTLVDLMRAGGGRVPVDEAVPILLQVLEGLEYAHSAEIPNVRQADGSFVKGRGLVHRDLKPANIFLAGAGKIRTAKIGDYGLAKAFDSAGLSGQTVSGTTAGTPAFMPRQQVINFKYAKPEVDVWAAAATLYYTLTGTPPRDFTGKDRWLVVLQTEPVPVRSRDASIPQPLAEVIDFALADKPEIRFKSAAEFKQALESVL